MFRLADGPLAAGLLALALGASAAHAVDYQLGLPITAAQIAPWDIDVKPDGTGLPPGKGSATEGQHLYDERCASCHGTFGDDPSYALLAGGIGTLKSSQPMRSVGSRLNYAPTLWDYINRAMPFASPKSLKPDEVYALTAYVLALNSIVAADAVLDETSLPKVRMPNRDGFTTAHGLGSVHGKPDTHNVECMHACATRAAITSEIPPDYVQTAYGDLTLQMRPLATMNHTGEPAWVRTGLQAADNTAGAKDHAVSGQALMQQAGCIACHAVDHKVVGPAFRDVADKYRGDAGAEARLIAKVQAGGSGVWGSVPMPPQTQLSENDLKAIVAWILAGADSN
jgi:cytochrome c551/c552